MRPFNLAPLYRSTVGFDRVFSLLDQVAGFDGAAPGYPPYNIERTGDNAYRISVAVAGFSERADHRGQGEHPTIRGDRQAKTEEKNGEVLYQASRRALRARVPARRSRRVKGACLGTGLLHVELTREVLTSKPRRPDRRRQSGWWKPRRRRQLHRSGWFFSTGLIASGAPNNSGALFTEHFPKPATRSISPPRRLRLAQLTAAPRERPALVPAVRQRRRWARRRAARSKPI